MAITKEVWVTTKFEGFHHWPEAPEQVAFLRNLHRHLFGVRVTVAVTHADRDVEFFMLQADVKFLLTALISSLRQNPRMSCEMMADFLFRNLVEKDYAVMSVGVDEDGENGAILYP